MPKPKLLWVSDSPTLKQVGQSRVTRGLVPTLIDKGFDIICYGFSHNNAEYVCPIVPANRGDAKHLDETLANLKPDIILFSHDCWLFPELPLLKSKYPNIKFVGYFTIDGGPIYSGWLPILRACDLIMVTCNYAKYVLQQRLAEIPIQVVPYGLEKEVFKPYASTKEESKVWAIDKSKSLFSRFGIAENYLQLWKHKKCFLFIGNNQSKKNIGCMLDALEIAVDSGLSEAFLILALHSKMLKTEDNKIMATEDVDMLEVIRTHKYANKIGYIDTVLEEQDVVSLYNYADAFLYPSIGESPGLQVHEASACGCVPIYTNWSGLTDVGENKGVPVPPAALIWGPFNTRRAIVESGALAKCMLGLATASVDKYEDLRKTGITSSFPNWEISGALMFELLRGTLVNADIIDLDVTDVGALNLDKVAAYSWI